MNTATMKRAAAFGVRYLITATEGTECLTRQQRNDLALAAAMLKAAPDLLANIGALCGAAEAGDGSDETQRALMRFAERLRRAEKLAGDRAYGMTP